MQQFHFETPTIQPKLRQKVDAPVPNSVQERSTFLNTDFTSTEHTQLLHSKLEREATKLHSWKIAAENDLVQKAKQLEDNQRTIDTQRKSILDLQVQNEDLSQRLQDEVSNRKEIFLKFESTQSICDVLRKHVVEVDACVEEFKQDKERIAELQADYCKKFQSLSNNGITLQTQLYQQQTRSSELEKQGEILRAQLVDALTQSDQLHHELRNITSLHQETEERLIQANGDLATTRCDLQSMIEQREQERKMSAENLAVLSEKCSAFELKVKELSTTLTTLEEEKKVLTLDSLRLATVLEEKKTLDENLSEQRSENVTVLAELSTCRDQLQLLKDQSEKLEDKLHVAEKDRETAQLEMDILQQRYDEIEKTADQQIALVESSLEERIKSLTAATEKISELELKISELSEEVSKLTEIEETLLSKLKLTEENLDAVSVAKSALENQVRDITESMTSLNLEKTSLQDTIDHDKTAFVDFQASHEELLKASNAEKDKLNEELSELKIELETGKADSCKLEAKIHELSKELNERAGQLQKVLKDFSDEKTSLANELELKNSRISLLEKEAASKQDTVCSQQQRIQDLEQKNSELTNELELIAKSVNSTADQANASLLVKDKKINELQSKLDAQYHELQREITHLQTEKAALVQSNKEDLLTVYTTMNQSRDQFSVDLKAKDEEIASLRLDLEKKVIEMKEALESQKINMQSDNQLVQPKSVSSMVAEPTLASQKTPTISYLTPQKTNTRTTTMTGLGLFASPTSSIRSILSPTSLSLAKTPPTSSTGPVLIRSVPKIKLTNPFNESAAQSKTTPVNHSGRKPQQKLRKVDEKKAANNAAAPSSKRMNNRNTRRLLCKEDDDDSVSDGIAAMDLFKDDPPPKTKSTRADGKRVQEKKATQIVSKGRAGFVKRTHSKSGISGSEDSLFDDPDKRPMAFYMRRKSANNPTPEWLSDKADVYSFDD